MAFGGIPYSVFQKDGDVSRDITQGLDPSARGPIDQLTALFQSTLGIDIAEDRRVHIDMEKNGRIRMTGYSRDGMEGSIVLKKQGAHWAQVQGIPAEQFGDAADALVRKVQAIAQPVLMPQAAADPLLSLPQMLDAESSALHQLIQAYTSKIARLKEQIEHYKKLSSNNSDGTNEKLASLEAQLRELDSNLIEKQDEIDTLQGQLESNEAELDRLKAEIASLKQKLESIDGLRAKLQAERAALQAEKALNSELNAQISMLKNQIEDLGEQLSELKETRDKLKETISKLEETNKKLEEDQAANIKAACDALRAQFASQLEASQKARSDLEHDYHTVSGDLRKKSQQLIAFCNDVRKVLHLGKEVQDDQILDRGIQAVEDVFKAAQRTHDAETSNALLARELSQAKQNQTRLIEMLAQKAPAAVDEASFILSRKRVVVIQEQIPDVKETRTVSEEILRKSLEDQGSPFELGPYQVFFYNETLNPDEQRARDFLTLCTQSQETLRQLQEVGEEIQQAGPDTNTQPLLEKQEQLKKIHEELLEKLAEGFAELQGAIQIPLISIHGSIHGEDVRLNPTLLEMALSFPQLPLVLVKGKRRFKVTRKEEVSAAALMSAALSVATADSSNETSAPALSSTEPALSAPLEPEESDEKDAEETEEPVNTTIFFPAAQVQDDGIDLASMQTIVSDETSLGFKVGDDQFYFKDEEDALTDVEEQLHDVFASATAAESVDAFTQKLGKLGTTISMPIDAQDERIDKTALTHALTLLAGKMILSIQLLYGDRVWTISSSQSQPVEAQE